MVHVNNEIRPTVGNIPLDVIDCFDRAIGICMSSFDNSYADVYFCLKLINRIYFSNPLENIFLGESLKSINAFFPLEVRKVYVLDDFILLLERECYKGNPIIVPINLKEVFYSEQYQLLDWAHPFVVKGVDRKRKVLKILDGTHLKSDFPEERDFSIPYDILEKSFNSYFKNINKKEEAYVIVFERSSQFVANNQDNKILGMDILIDFMKKIDVKNQIQIIETIPDVSTILNFSKRKRALFEIVLKEIKNIASFNNKQIANLELQIDKICDNWEKYCFLYAKSRLSRISLGKVNVDNAIITKEIIVLEKILSMVQEIKYKKKIPTILADTDSIICINKENIVFNFDGNRIYNSWLSDESPKVVFKDEKISVFEEEYFIKITEKRINIVAGFFINISGKLYYFGLDSCKRINVDIAGIESSVVQALVETDSVYLKLVSIKNELSFQYKLTEGDCYNELLSLKLSSNEIDNYGIGCKTYNKAKPIKVLFRNLRYKECKKDNEEKFTEKIQSSRG